MLWIAMIFVVLFVGTFVADHLRGGRKRMSLNLKPPVDAKAPGKGR